MDHQPDLFDSKAAHANADQAMARALDHADQVRPGWSNDALRLWRDYARTHPSFRTEDVRAHAQAHGFPPPPDERAWGMIARRAKAGRLVANDGYVTSRRPVAHARPVTLWRSLIRDQGNA